MDLFNLTLIVREFSGLLIIHNLFTMRATIFFKVRRWVDCLIIYFVISAIAQFLLDHVSPQAAQWWVLGAGTPILVILALVLIITNNRLSHLQL